MKGELLTIGEVSKLTGVPVKSIRHYCDMDVIRPAYIDKDSNYRYFTEKKVVIIKLIKSMRELDYNLEDIKVFLYKDNLEDVRDKLILNRTEKEEMIVKLKYQIEIINNLLVERRRLYPVKNDGEEYTVEIKHIEDRFIIFKDKKIKPNYSVIKKNFNDVNRVIKKEEIKSKDVPMLIFNKSEMDSDEILACISIEAEYSAGILSPNVKILSAGDFLSITYVGKHKMLRGKIYPYILEWMNVNEYECSGEIIEIYKSSFEDGDSDDNVFEIQIKLKDR
jgi:DNA-binding transcriptional MerR regulator